MSGPGSSSLQTQSSVAHAALLNSLNKDLSETRFLKSELRGRQRRAALVGEAYIVAPSSNCQHAFPSFLNFLRQTKNPQQQSNKTLRNVTKSSHKQRARWFSTICNPLSGAASGTCYPRRAGRELDRLNGNHLPLLRPAKAVVRQNVAASGHRARHGTIGRSVPNRFRERVGRSEHCQIDTSACGFGLGRSRPRPGVPGHRHRSHRSCSRPCSSAALACRASTQITGRPSAVSAW